MGTEREGIELIKLTKEEKEQQQAALKRAKQEAYEKIPEKDREKKKKYQIMIIKTLVLFVAALVVLGCIAAGAIETTPGILIILVLCIISTYITRKDR